MEEALTQPARPHLRHGVINGSLPASCQPSPSASTPPIPISLPGAGPLETLHLGYDPRASPFQLADLDHVLCDNEHILRRIPTLVSSKSTNSQYAELALSLRTSTRYKNSPVNNNLRCPEIACPQATAETFDTCSHNSTCDCIFNGLSLSTRRRSQLETRSLTTLSNVHIITMTTTTTTSIPGSPPDLSGSRSSKSSSYSSTFSSPDGLDSDTINFEEIGLEDDKQTPTINCHSRDVSMQSVGSENGLMRAKDPASGEKRQALPQLQTSIKFSHRMQDSATPKPVGSRMSALKRQFTTPETFHAQGTPRTRSTSPPQRRPLTSMSTNSLSAGGLRPTHKASLSSLGVPSRRSSWQPQRKSVKELEAEYNDSDDDLPDDASLWNVPVSPLPSGQRSHRSSFRGSPDRDGPSQSPRPIPLAHAITAPETPPHPHMHSQSLPKNRPPPARSATLSATDPPSPRRLNVLRNSGRTKSWNLAMAELSEEARIISEALVYHADLKEQVQAEALSGRSSPDSQHSSESRPKSAGIQLPPIQKSTLDFMPISKEKEAILSRTRPSWLPPKDPKEERRHLKEYQRMMAASVDAEKKRRTQLQVQRCEKDDTRESLNRIWQYYVDETTDISTIDNRVNDLCWRGISPNLRGRVWQRAIGNPLGLTVKSYEKALQRAKDIKERPTDQLDSADKSIERLFLDIERDAETAFPELNLFQRNAPLWQDLADVCEAYACYRSDVGYIYGIQLIAALLLLQLPTPADAFILLANSLNRPIPLAFQTNDATTTARTYNHAVSTLAMKYPRIHEYLFGSIEQGGLGFSGDEVFEPMLRTMFSNGLDVDRLCRIWDIWVFEGDRTLVRAAVATLSCLQTQLFDVRGDVDLKRRNVQEMLGWGPFNRQPHSGHWNLQTVGNEEKFVEEIRLAGVLDYTGK
ncbi:hypothetical protein EDD37DRAFT_118367 [Exophiala viscosa]|uniref:uncharacterized protein n=1 Tax=Exophiala viscosa TaxID=2486360 RepID=UPI0021908251|nr:hypothetical protein EDD37DRAFT_118367 [Exophiala viscosa]